MIWYVRLSSTPPPELGARNHRLSVSARALDARWNLELRLRRLRPCALVMRRRGVKQMEYSTVLFSLYEIIIIP